MARLNGNCYLQYFFEGEKCINSFFIESILSKEVKGKIVSKDFNFASFDDNYSLFNCLTNKKNTVTSVDTLTSEEEEEESKTEYKKQKNSICYLKFESNYQNTSCFHCILFNYLQYTFFLFQLILLYIDLSTSFKDSYESSWSCFDMNTYINYERYIIYGNWKEEITKFGGSPLNNYQNLLDKYEKKSEFAKLKEKTKIQKALDKLNAIVASLPVFHFVLQKPLKEKKKCYKKFSCSCGKIFNTPQGLGGHRSKQHRFQNSNYSKKKYIRMKREPKRLINAQAKAFFLNKYNLDYEKLQLSKEGKKKVKDFMKKHKKEFTLIKKKFQISQNFEDK